MFHRINDATQGFLPQHFAPYLTYLVNNFPIVVPGDPLPDCPVAICLTFDDAYYDFYHDVFPLLRHHNIKAVLAVPVQYIVDKTQVSAKERLSVPYVQGMENPLLAEKVPFCTWEELHEMSQSGHVVIASHSFSHANLADKKADLSKEIIYSQLVLQKKLKTAINSFVYPYGKMNYRAHKMVCQFYQFGIRIGSALNVGWDDQRQYIYRINADPLWTDLKPINSQLINKLTLKYWANRLRLK